MKNISIGVGSSNGKAYINSGSKTASADSIWSNLAEQEVFIESIADAAKAPSSSLMAKSLASAARNTASSPSKNNPPLPLSPPPSHPL